MKTGDLIAFGGKGLVSDLIKAVTKSSVSHVGLVMMADCGGFRLNNVVEANGGKKSGMSGVHILRLRDRVEKYNGSLWWYPLSDLARGRMNTFNFCKFLLKMEGRPYDAPQAIKSAVDFTPDQEEDFSKLFCSELAAEGYERAGIIRPVNAAEMTPQDVIDLHIYKEPSLLIN